MTDTGREAVERLAYLLSYPREEAPWRAACEEAAVTLRALAAERDAARQALMACHGAMTVMSDTTAGDMTDGTAARLWNVALDLAELTLAQAQEAGGNG